MPGAAAHWPGRGWAGHWASAGLQRGRDPVRQAQAWGRQLKEKEQVGTEIGTSLGTSPLLTYPSPSFQGGFVQFEK